MNILWYSILATFVVSLLSLIGILTLSIKDKLLHKILHWLVGFSAGALMGGALLHLIPEARDEFPDVPIYLYVVIGFSIFFLMEKILHWRHCHEDGGECEVHTFTYMNLIGDSVHNFIDGLIIVSSFSVSPTLGIATTIAVITHELPQEIADFGVLVYGGFSKFKALFYNFITALTSVLGAVIGYFALNHIDSFNEILLPFAAGGFLYIAASDLIPELHKEKNIHKSFQAFTFFILGIAFMLLLKH